MLQTKPLRQHVSDSACASRTVIQMASGLCHKNLLVEHFIKLIAVLQCDIHEVQYQTNSILNHSFEKSSS